MVGVNDSVPLVSLVTPTFNMASSLPICLESVRDQSYPALEHIVVDGGSTDGTVELLRETTDVRWISESDGGQSNALNKGFRMATGSIMGWINADDSLLPGAVAAVAKVLRTTPPSASSMATSSRSKADVPISWPQPEFLIWTGYGEAT